MTICYNACNIYIIYVVVLFCTTCITLIWFGNNKSSDELFHLVVYFSVD